MERIHLYGHFWYHEFSGLTDNSPQWLKDMAFMLARKIDIPRCAIQVPFLPTSFYRSPEKNANTNYAQKGSLHTRGLAADFTVQEHNKHLLKHIYDFIRTGMDFGELFLYELPDGTYDSIHISLPAQNNDRQANRYVKTKDNAAAPIIVPRAEYYKNEVAHGKD